MLHILRLQMDRAGIYQAPANYQLAKFQAVWKKKNYDNFVEKGIYHNGSHFSSKLIYLSENLKMVLFPLKYINTGTK